MTNNNLFSKATKLGICCFDNQLFHVEEASDASLQKSFQFFKLIHRKVCPLHVDPLQGFHKNLQKALFVFKVDLISHSFPAACRS